MTRDTGQQEVSEVVVDPGGDASQPRPYRAADRLWRPTLAVGAGLLGCAVTPGTWNDRSGVQPLGWTGLRLALAATGGAFVAAAATYACLRPPRKAERGHDAADPTLLPRLDPRASRLSAGAAVMDLDARRRALAIPVDRKIHQVWLGDPAGLAGRDRPWRDYAARFGLEYTLWSEASLSSLPMLPNNGRILAHALSTGNWWMAADILRLEIIAEHGGIYVDADWRPPSLAGQPLAPDALMPMTGLTLITEPFARDVGAQQGIFVNNSWIAAGAEHPLVLHARAGLAENWASAVSGLGGPVPPGGGRAMYATGPFMLNRMLAGPLHILTFAEAERLGMVAF